MTDSDFDFTDVAVDGVREVLDVAVSVLRDYAPDHGNTRIERLARYLLLNVKADVTTEGSLAGDELFGADVCREMATYWLLMADKAEDLAC